MISVVVKENESVERAMKRFKKRVEQVGLYREVRGRGAYVKPSVRRRSQRLRALHQQRTLNLED